MTKFAVETSDFEKSSLSAQQIEELMTVLMQKVESLQKLKNAIIKQMKEEHSGYRLKTIGKNFVMVITKEYCGEEELCIGYPFPIYSQVVRSEKNTDFKVKYFLRGQPLRLAQRKNFIAKLKAEKFNIKETSVSALKDFRDIVKRQFHAMNISQLNYIDLYRFLGDAFLSTYMLDIFRLNYPCKKQIIYSQNYKNLRGFYTAVPLSDIKNSDNSALFVFSDLLDIDDAFVQDTFLKYKKDGIYIINSRNLFITKNGKEVHIFTLADKHDVLLTGDNIFNYMKNCVRPFVQKINLSKSDKIEKHKIDKIYINPYASLAQKSLSSEEIKNIVSGIKETLSEVQIFIPAGHNAETKKYTDKIKREVSVEVLQDAGIYDLYDKIKKNNINLVITVDSAITHILTKVGIRNIVLYKNGFWDAKSLQSISAESPIAFCSSLYWQYPLILNSDKDLTALFKLIEYLHNPKIKVPVIQNLDLTNKCFNKKTNDKIKAICEQLNCNDKLKKEFSA